MPTNRKTGYRDLVGYYVGASYEAGTFTGSINDSFVDSLVDMNEAGTEQCALTLTTTTPGYGGICMLTASDAKIVNWINEIINNGSFYNASDPEGQAPGTAYLRIKTGHPTRTYATLYIVSGSNPAVEELSNVITAGTGVTKGIAVVDVSGVLNQASGLKGWNFLTRIYNRLIDPTPGPLDPLLTGSVPVFGVGAEFGEMSISSSYAAAITDMMVIDKAGGTDSIVEGAAGDLIYYTHIRSGSADVVTTSAQAPGC